jgi:O-acetyl-ADP-ribose deacetylase (regulator of RNase III)
MLPKGKSIVCQRGDIAEVVADAIVNAANNHLWMGSGVAGAIKRKGGDQIEREAVEKGPIPIGEALVTTAGRLEARCVIHAAAMGLDWRTDETKIKQATLNSLKRAEELKLESIALPALGTGVGGFPIEKCAEVMIPETLEFLTSSVHLKKAIFVLFDEGGYHSFETKRAGLLGSGAS